jgi:hypothetical protein
MLDFAKNSHSGANTIAYSAIASLKKKKKDL